MTIRLPRSARLAAFLVAVTCCGSAPAQTTVATARAATASALCDAPLPQSQPFARPNAQRFEYALPARRYAEVIEPGQAAQILTPTQKLIFSLTLVARPLTLLPALYSASYEQLFLTDPKYGHDAGAFGEKYGAAMLRTTSVRVFSNGIFAAAFHQDPRYYRIGSGSLVHRGLLSARQAIIRRNDEGDDQFNYSGILGRAAAAALVVTYYPEPSITTRVVASTFLTSIATDAGGNMVVEFLPNIIRRFPIMQKLRLE